MSEEITNEISPGEMKIEDRVENLYQGAFKSIESLDNLFKKGGFLEQSVGELGGDIAWFNDVRNALDNAMEQIEESHMGAVAHLQMKDESVEQAENVNEAMACNCNENCACGGNCTPDCNCKPDCGPVTEESGIDRKLVGELNMILQRSGL